MIGLNNGIMQMIKYREVPQVEKTGTIFWKFARGSRGSFRYSTCKRENALLVTPLCSASDFIIKFLIVRSAAVPQHSPKGEALTRNKVLDT